MHSAAGRQVMKMNAKDWYLLGVAFVYMAAFSSLYTQVPGEWRGLGCKCEFICGNYKRGHIAAIAAGVVDHLDKRRIPIGLNENCRHKGCDCSFHDLYVYIEIHDRLCVL